MQQQAALIKRDKESWRLFKLSRNASLLALLLAMVLITSCGEDRSTSTKDNIHTGSDPVAIYNIATGDIPFPNIALYSPNDYTLNIPDLDESDYSDPQVAMNASWGFSTNAPMSLHFSATADSTTLASGVKVYRLLFDPVTQGQATLNAILSDPVTNCASTLSALSNPGQFVPALSGQTLVISPTQVLQPGNFYMMVVTDQVSTQDGSPFKADVVYQLLQGSNALYDSNKNQSLIGIAPDPADAAALESLRQITNLTEAVAKICDGSSIGSANIISSSVFYTAPAGAMLQAAKGEVPNTVSSVLQATGTKSSNNAADIYVGTISLPYYLYKPSDAHDSGILSGFWKNSSNSYLTPLDPIPKATQDPLMTVPLLMTFPNKFNKTSMKGVVIFQHGITSNRSALLGIADALAESGYAAVAIDLPLHGILASDPNVGALYQAGNEPNFDLDLNNDGVVDPSGSYFINLANLLVTRDNVQQAVANLFALRQAIDNMDYDGDSSPDFSGKDVFFVGHSLGAIVGIPFVALESATEIKAAVFGMPGGALPKVLDGSAAFGPAIAAGLAKNGVNKGSADYEAFMLAAQTVLDPTDPINFAAVLSTDPRGILGISVHNDLVVPNIVPDLAVSPAGTVEAPLAGTNPLFASMGLEQFQVNTTKIGLHAWMEFGEFLDGNRVCQDPAPNTVPVQVLHTSLLLDDGVAMSASSAVRAEMQHEVRAFLETSGNSLNIADKSYLCAH